MGSGTLLGLRSVEEGKWLMWVPVFECVVDVDGERRYRVDHAGDGRCGAGSAVEEDQQMSFRTR